MNKINLEQRAWRNNVKSMATLSEKENEYLMIFKQQNSYKVLNGLIKKTVAL